MRNYILLYFDDYGKLYIYYIQKYIYNLFLLNALNWIVTEHIQMYNVFQYYLKIGMVLDSDGKAS